MHATDPSAGHRAADAPKVTASPLSPAAAGRWVRFRLLDGCLLLAGGLLAALQLSPLDAALATGWLAATIAVVRSDLADFIIPDTASAVIAALGLLEAGSRARAEGDPLPGVLWGAAGNGALAFCLFWVMAWLYRRCAGRDGLGFGDVKLAGACGLWLTPGQGLVALELACVTAVAVLLLLSRGRARRGTAVPFGAFLAPAAWLVFMLSPALPGVFGT